jgi:positive regulator of sigma E activity
MEKEVGRVIKIKGNEAEVVLHSRTACGHCGARFACVAGAILMSLSTVIVAINARFLRIK